LGTKDVLDLVRKARSNTNHCRISTPNNITY